MKKEKEIHFRVSGSFYDMLTKVCEELDCSKTDYLIERALSPDYKKIYRDSWEDDFEKKLGSISNNLNQMARALNEMKKKLSEHEYLDPEYFANFLNDLAFDIQEVRQNHLQIMEQMTDEERNLFHYVNSRELLQPVIDVLQEEDQEYLEQLKKIDSGI